MSLPEDLDYDALPGLSNEIRQKLKAVRPITLGQAGRIDGMTPAALTLLLAHVRKGRRGEGVAGSDPVDFAAAEPARRRSGTE